ncbi:MAG: DUF4150 domain-containing protein [Desulfobacteraceae bacterium]|nr:DUF4150 domain-containing protein [Desulfobacteraceae bacterium]
MVFANNSMPTGMDITFLDVCKVPVPPAIIVLPLPNIAMKTMAIPPTANMKYLILFMQAHHVGTTVATSMGDYLGALGGVASQIIIGPARNITCSMKVISGGMPATRWLDMTMQNLINTTGQTLSPGQFKVLYLT